MKYIYSKEEKYLLCDTIEKYIEIANINDTTLDDYFSIIAFIKILISQYPLYRDSFNKYLQIFKNKGILKKYYFSNNFTKKYIFKHKNDIKLAENISLSFLEGCTSRFFSYLVAIAICGRPDTIEKRRILARSYNWNSYSLKKQAIYYTDLSLKDNPNDDILIQEQAYNYNKMHDYDMAIKLSQKAYNISGILSHALCTIKFYRHKNDLESCIKYLKSLKVNNYEDKKFLEEKINNIEKEISKF